MEKTPIYYARVKYVNTVTQVADVLVPIYEEDLKDSTIVEVVEASERVALKNQHLLDNKDSVLKIEKVSTYHQVLGFAPVDSNGEVIEEEFVEL
jgi:hypothetical protein